MPRKLSRRTCSSAHADAFVFEVESIEDSARGPNKETLVSQIFFFLYILIIYNKNYFPVPENTLHILEFEEN